MKKWILNIFDGNEEKGQEYVKMIVDEEGFDNIDVFCSMRDDDLKEIGIDKKGDRMKILHQIKRYNQMNGQTSVIATQEQNIASRSRSVGVLEMFFCVSFSVFVYWILENFSQYTPK